MNEAHYLLAEFIKLPAFDFTVNIPTLLVLLGGLYKFYRYISRMVYEVDIMWQEFIKLHPEYARVTKGSSIIIP